MVEFGYTKKDEYSKYLGEWVTIYPIGLSAHFSGRIQKIEDGYALLNPFVGEEVKEGKLVNALIENEKGSLVPLNGNPLEQLSEKHLYKKIEILNKKLEQDNSKKQINKDNQ